MIAVLAGVFGLILGSFVNALVWRLHEQERLGGKKDKAAVTRRRALSIATGRSMCSKCGHELGAKDLVPVFSWLALRGRCRYCHAKIEDNPLVEAATGVLFAVSYLAWPFGFHGEGLFQFVLWLGFVVGFVALTVYDLRWMLLPDRIVFPLIVLAALQTVVRVLWLRSWPALYEPLIGVAIIFGLFWGLFQVSKGRWIGGGDVKLALVLGLLASTPLRAFLVIFLASLCGTLASVPVLFRGGHGMMTRIPFGPYLIAATFIVVLWGQPLVDWYQRLLLG